MHRWTPLAFGLLFVAAIIGIMFASRVPPTDTVAMASASASAPLPIASDNPVPVDAGVERSDTMFSSAASSAFNKLPDGGAVPPLPETAPKTVQVGVVLFQYRGAQGASVNARSKESARTKAEQALATAEKDFDEAVKLGDPGSLANAGNIPRGVLEPVLEHTIFTLELSAVHPAPLDTPRGFWIVRRIK